MMPAQEQVHRIERQRETRAKIVSEHDRTQQIGAAALVAFGHCQCSGHDSEPGCVI
jgi:hypothetical protein